MSDSKQRILDAASALFLEHGSKGLSARAIATKAGLSTMGIYSHFNGMQGILDTLYVEGFDMVKQAVDLPIEQIGFDVAVVRATQNYFQFAETHGAHYRLIFGIGDGGYQPSDEAKLEAEKAFAKLVGLVARGLPEHLSWQERQHAAMKIWALVHGFVTLHLNPLSDMVDMDDWKERATESVVLMVDAMRRHYAA